MEKYWNKCPECGYYPSVMNVVITESGEWYDRKCAEKIGLVR